MDFFLLAWAGFLERIALFSQIFGTIRFVIVESALSFTIQRVYRHSTQIILKQTMLIDHNRIKNPNWREAAPLAIYKRGRGFKLTTTENKSSKWPERESNPGSPACESDALNTATLPSVPWISSLHLHIDSYLQNHEFLVTANELGRLPLYPRVFCPFLWNSLIIRLDLSSKHSVASVYLFVIWLPDKSFLSSHSSVPLLDLELVTCNGTHFFIPWQIFCNFTRNFFLYFHGFLVTRAPYLIISMVFLVTWPKTSFFISSDFSFLSLKLLC